MRSDDPLRRLGQRGDRRVPLGEKFGHESVRLRQPFDLDCRRLDRVLDALKAVQYLGRRRAGRALMPQLEIPTKESQRSDKRGGAAPENHDLQNENV